MILVNRVLAVLALALFAAFCLVIVVFVPDIDLSVVILGTVALAGYDFWRTLFAGGAAG